MSPSVFRSSVPWPATLLLGALLCALLWLVGLPELGWLGFVTAALVGPAASEVRCRRSAAVLARGRTGDGR